MDFCKVFIKMMGDTLKSKVKIIQKAENLYDSALFYIECDWECLQELQEKYEICEVNGCRY